MIFTDVQREKRSPIRKISRSSGKKRFLRSVTGPSCRQRWEGTGQPMSGRGGPGWLRGHLRGPSTGVSAACEATNRPGHL